MIHTALLVLHKDLVLEWRDRARLNATLFFVVCVLLALSFAVGPAPALLARLLPGFVWVTVLLASILVLGESWRIEKDDDAIDGLKLLPVNLTGLFLGKALANTLLLFGLALATLLLTLLLYGPFLRPHPPRLALVLLLGAGAIGAPGTLHAAIAAQARAREVLLPLLLFPIMVPGLLALIRATTLGLYGDPESALTGWLALLSSMNLIYWPVCGLVFGRVLDE